MPLVTVKLSEVCIQKENLDTPPIKEKLYVCIWNLEAPSTTFKAEMIT
jgi:hypothetical protein